MLLLLPVVASSPPATIRTGDAVGGYATQQTNAFLDEACKNVRSARTTFNDLNTASGQLWAMLTGAQPLDVNVVVGSANELAGAVNEGLKLLNGAGEQATEVAQMTGLLGSFLSGFRNGLGEGRQAATANVAPPGGLADLFRSSLARAAAAAAPRFRSAAAVSDDGSTFSYTAQMLRPGGLAQRVSELSVVASRITGA